MLPMALFPASLGPLATGWLEGLERAILHFLTCDLYSEGATRFFGSFQSDKTGIPLLLVGLALFGGWNAPRAWRAFLTLAVGIGAAMLVASVLWQVVDRQRPPHHYEVLLRTPAEKATCASRPDALALHSGVSTRRSFPSRHALTTGVTVAALWMASRLLGVLGSIYALILLVGRVYIGKHWPTDMLVGAAIGLALGVLAWRLLPRLLRLARHPALAAWIED